MAVANFAMPPRLNGQSVLDVNVRDGFLCHEAARRGAQSVVGFFRGTEPAVSKRTDIESRIEFRRLDVECSRLDKPFDYVFCLDLLERVRNPFLLLDRLMETARKRLVIDVSGVGLTEQKRLKLRWPKRWFLRRLGNVPALFANRRPLIGSRCWYFFSPTALKTILTEHRNLFARVDIIRPNGIGRILLVAHRRRIRRLVLVAGPTASGKTTIITRLLSGQAPSLADALGIDDVKSWRGCDLHGIMRDSSIDLGNIVVHYDFLSILKTDSEHHQIVELRDLLDCADDVRLVTIWTEPSCLLQQFEQNEVARFGGRPRGRKNEQLWRDYRDPAKLLKYYDDWFLFTGSLPAEHHVLVASLDMELIPFEKWRNGQAWANKTSGL